MFFRSLKNLTGTAAVTGAIGVAFSAFQGEKKRVKRLRDSAAAPEFTDAFPDDDSSGRVLVVGAGVAGVSTAYAFVKKGYSVAVLEAGDAAGSECRYPRKIQIL
jgi:NADPH-dependent 2,4-dienoyl-CoA reductase/sulfur reductase-like enzyme